MITFLYNMKISRIETRFFQQVAMACVNKARIGYSVLPYLSPIKHLMLLFRELQDFTLHFETAMNKWIHEMSELIPKCACHVLQTLLLIFSITLMMPL